ncbi:MAG: cadherin-like domain-containing protein, partial [Gammaproteobacteria bacterium]|nr:cadherin-like domain-containing protein [Gammaproteobacteria bacterium]
QTVTSTLEITGTNDAPTLSASDNGFDEDMLENGIAVSANASNLFTFANDIDDVNSTLQISAVNGATLNVGSAVVVTLAYTDADGVAQTQDVNLTVNADGSYSIDAFDLDALPNGSVATGTFTYQVADDEGGESQTVTSTLEITGTNDGLLATVDVDANASVVAEDLAVGSVVGITAEAIDPDNAASDVSYELVDAAGIAYTGPFAIDAATGVVTVAAPLDAETALSHSFYIRATSADGSSTTSAEQTVTVTDVDEFDVTQAVDADAIPNEVSEDAAIGTASGIIAEAFDSDVTNNTVTYSLVEAADPAQIMISDGSIIASDSGFTVYDGSNSNANTVMYFGGDIPAGGFASFTFEHLDGGPLNIDVLSEDTVGAPAGSVFRDVNGDGTQTDWMDLSIKIFDVASGLQIATNDDGPAGNDGSVSSWDPGAGWADSLVPGTYRVEIRESVDDPTPFLLSITGNNSASVNPYEMAQSTTATPTTHVIDAATILANAEDTAGDNIQIQSVENAQHGTVSINADGDIEFVPDADYAGPASFTYTVVDPDGNTDQARITLNVTGVNTSGDQPVLVDDPEFVSSGTVAFQPPTPAYSGPFEIDPNTGDITVSGALDAETDASHSFRVVAESTDGSTSTSAVMTVNVTDVDDFDITVATDTDATANAIDENAAAGTLVGVTANAFDADITTNQVTYSLVDNNGGNFYSGPFAIDADSGEVTVAGGIAGWQLDRENFDSRDFWVRAESADGSVSYAHFNVSLNDVDEFDISATQVTYTGSSTVDETLAVGTVLGFTANASDFDATDTVSYELINTDGSAYTGNLAIDAVTGVVSVGNAMDYETADEERFRVRSTSTDGTTSESGIQTLVLNDVNEFTVSAISDADATVDAVDELANAGDTVGVTASAFDGDATNSDVTFELASDNTGTVYTGPFEIDTNTGVVTVKAGFDPNDLDYDIQTSQSFWVKASSSDGSETFKEFTVDINEFINTAISPVVVSATGDGTVDENAAIGTGVGITASADDIDSHHDVSYRLVDADGVSPYTGNL